MAKQKQRRYPTGRHCTSVKRDKSGNCRCGSYGRGHEGESVIAQCRRAGIPYKIGGRDLTKAGG